MAAEREFADALVIGGGFYGTAIAAYLARRGVGRVVLAEQSGALLTRASFNNQARVHNGYHYPRSFTTAYRSRVNLPRFVRTWPAAVRQDFTQLYAIARQNSKVTAGQFERFCRDVGARFSRAPAVLRELFNDRLVEDVYVVEECAFDSRALAAAAERETAECGVEVLLDTKVCDVAPMPAGDHRVSLTAASGEHTVRRCARVFNCTYAGLNHLGPHLGVRMPLKQEIAEMALLRPPAALQGLGITLMDGPFFSFMPFPARGLHSLSHVRYTPHQQWADVPQVDPYARLAAYPKLSRVDRMLRDAARYLPAILDATYVESLFEVKTVLEKNESDDGRPILFEKHAGLPGCYSILGGKIDNLFDVLEKLDAENLELSPARQAAPWET
jgi:glycine/D-amino acid oxidase-like deaminating enzyme